MLDVVKSQLQASCEVKEKILADADLLASIADVAARCIEAVRQGNKVMLAGNGGSAADAQHIAAEFIGRFEVEREGLPAIALPANSSTMTSLGNDYGYDAVFRRQVQALGRPGDVFVGISTSGNSPNVVAAIEECRKQGITAIGLTGEGGGRMAELCDVCLRVPSKNTARIQESHITIGHIICSLVDRAMVSG
jgi:D-sedoheptulose 7-phosphate isomerase